MGLSRVANYSGNVSNVKAYNFMMHNDKRLRVNVNYYQESNWIRTRNYPISRRPPTT